MNYLPRLTSKCNPPNLSLPSSYDYRREPQAQALDLASLRAVILVTTVSDKRQQVRQEALSVSSYSLQDLSLRTTLRPSITIPVCQ
jgi:hypothetical protein